MVVNVSSPDALKISCFCVIHVHHSIGKHQTLLDGHRYPHHRSQLDYRLINCDLFSGRMKKFCLTVEQIQNKCQANKPFRGFSHFALYTLRLTTTRNTQPRSKSTRCISSTSYLSVSLPSLLSGKVPPKGKTLPNQKTTPDRNIARHQSTSAATSTKDSTRVLPPWHRMART